VKICVNFFLLKRNMFQGSEQMFSKVRLLRTTLMDIHGQSVDMDIDMNGKFHIHGKSAGTSQVWSFSAEINS